MKTLVINCTCGCKFYADNCNIIFNRCSYHATSIGYEHYPIEWLIEDWSEEQEEWIEVKEELK